jgi:hypothetical protein
VGGIAGCRLLCLRQNKLPVAGHGGAERVALFCEPTESADVNNRSHAWNLDDGPVESNIIVNSGWPTHKGVPAYDCGLDHFARGEINYYGHYSRVREIDGLDRIARFKQHRFLWKLDHLQMWQ